MYFRRKRQEKGGETLEEREMDNGGLKLEVAEGGETLIGMEGLGQQVGSKAED